MPISLAACNWTSFFGLQKEASMIHRKHGHMHRMGAGFKTPAPGVGGNTINERDTILPYSYH